MPRANKVLREVLLNSNITAVPTTAPWEPQHTLRGQCFPKPNKQYRPIQTQWAGSALSVKTRLGSVLPDTPGPVILFSGGTCPFGVSSKPQHEGSHPLWHGSPVPSTPECCGCCEGPCAPRSHTPRALSPHTCAPPGWDNYSYLKCPHLEAF